jgi:hypothetical protein
MALTGKEKQAKYRAKMRAAGYKLVQVWVKDRKGEEFKRYIKALEAGLKSPKTSLKWDCERVILEIHKKSWDIASRDRLASGLMEGLFEKVREEYEAKRIPGYMYLDIVELLRPLLGEDMYRENKTWYVIEKARKRIRVFNALLVEMWDSVNSQPSELDNSLNVADNSGIDDILG